MPKYSHIDLKLGDRSYELIIGSGVLSDRELIRKSLTGFAASKVVVISNDTVSRLYANKLDFLANDYPLLKFNIRDGEQYKSQESLQQIYDFLLGSSCNRDILICALGGGVVGDIAGFAAATYQRGVHYIQIPTTLLAQVDSSVGGKTAINHKLGKNMIGAFYQPDRVLIDTSTLKTLPARELSAGLAEVIKYALIQDIDFFQWLENNLDALMEHDETALRYAVEKSCQHKAKIVEEDEKEQGNRALLNLGHSFGHAIERYTGYSQWLHGEAVAAGMVCAARVSHAKGNINQAELSRITHLIERAQLPTELPDGLDTKTLLSLMELDKKNRRNKLRLILMKSLGQSYITEKVQGDELQKVLG